jgi:hypothetical protein
MCKGTFLRLVTFGCATLLVSSSWAATIEPGQGNLSVNQGQGFQPVNSRVDANVGDAVMVGPGGAATVTYEDGCKVTVQPGAVATVAPISPCASGSYADDTHNSDGLLWTGVALGAAGLGLGIGALVEKHTTNVTTPFYCGSISNPCFNSVSP